MRVLFAFLLLSFMVLRVGSSNASVIVVVFENALCELSAAAVGHYQQVLRQKNYNVVPLCVPPMPVRDLQGMIKQRVAGAELDWEQVKGINLFGSVISTVVSNSLHNRTSAVFASSVLAFDDLEFIFSDKDVLINIKEVCTLTPIKRWVSHQRSVTDNMLWAADQLMPEGENNAGKEHFRDYALRLNECWVKTVRLGLGDQFTHNAFSGVCTIKLAFILFRDTLGKQVATAPKCQRIVSGSRGGLDYINCKCKLCGLEKLVFL